jgi:hypothetical protein
MPTKFNATDDVVLALTQSIFDLVVTPGPRAVGLTFRTERQCLPYIAIFRFNTGDVAMDLVPANRVSDDGLSLVFDGLLGTRRFSHKYRLPNLEEDTHYWFQITAASDLAGFAAAIATGTFYTCTRQVSVTVQELLVIKGGNAEYRFGVFEGPAGDKLQGPSRYPTNGQVDTSQGLDIRYPFSSDVMPAIQNPPNQIVLYGLAINRHPPEICFFDTDVCIPYPGAGLDDLGEGFPDTTPDSVSNVSNSFKDETDALGTFTLPEMAGANQQMPFSITSGGGYNYFTFNGSLVTTVKPPRHPPMLPTKLSRSYEIPGQASAKNYGRAVFVKYASQRRAATVAPNGSVWWLRVADRRPMAGEAWTPIGGEGAGPMAVAASADGQIHVVQLAHNGNLLYASWNDLAEASPKPVWINLGGAFVGELAVSPRSDNAVEIFALTKDDELLHQRRLANSRRPNPKWSSLAGGMASSLCLVKRNRELVWLFALSRDGGVTAVEYRGASGRSKRFTLGGNFDGEIGVSAHKEGPCDLLVVTRDRTAYGRRFSGKPESAGVRWQKLGPYDPPAAGSKRRKGR